MTRSGRWLVFSIIRKGTGHDMKQEYITVTRIDDYVGREYFRPGMELLLKKEFNNPYDDEAIAVYTSSINKCGYVANSVDSVCRGTHSAGYVHHLIVDEAICIVRFVCESCLIAELAVILQNKL